MDNAGKALRGVALALGLLLGAAPGPLRAAQDSSPPAPAPSAQGPAEPVRIPNYWDPRQRPERPDVAGLRVIRFLTEDDYPPLHFATEDGKLAGFNIDLARAICDVLRVPCTVQARRWDTLLESLKEGRGDAVIASLRITPTLRASYGFSQAYLRTPARFVGKATGPRDIDAGALGDRTVGVVASSAHEAYLKTFAPAAKLRTFDTLEATEGALERGEIDLLFGDGLTLSLWLNGASGSACCRFVGGPYTESRFFGEGVGIATRPDDALLRRALDYALLRVAEKGVFDELYLQYFPVSFY
jgi:polar amino acid transport system substrate-binding protein